MAGSPAPSAAPEPLDIIASVTKLAAQVRHGLVGSSASGLLQVAEQARAASAWLASVELEAVSRLVREQTREARAEAEALSTAAGTGGGTGTGSGASAQAEVDGWDWTVAEVACAFRVTTRQAESRVGLAMLLRDLPRVHGLLRAGQIDEYRARVIAETLEASALCPADPGWAQVLGRVCAKAPERTHVQVRQHLNRLLLKIDPHAVARRRAKALAGREVRCWAEPDGMATLQAKLSGETAAIIDTALNAMADGARDHQHEPGALIASTHQERRADALGEVFRSILEGRTLHLVPITPETAAPGTAAPGTTEGRQRPGDPGASDPGASDPHASNPRPGDAATKTAPTPESGPRVPAWWKPPPLPTRKGRRAHLIVTISERTLNGQDEAPAELAGYGPIPADIGRQIAREAGTRTIVPLPRPVAAGSTRSRPVPPPDEPSDIPQVTSGASSAAAPDGAAACAESSCGTDRYGPGQTLIDAVIATYPTCQAPGCTRAATHCDLDHVIPYRHGGRTCRHNLRPLCRRHHRLKTHARWRRNPAEPSDGSNHPPGTITWTTRLGRHYTVPPPDRPGSSDW